DGCYEWMPGLYGGRILESREPTDSTDENSFLAVTVTQAL
ncbi:jg22164, partial [Pararge aegeria aegeria]